VLGWLFDFKPRFMPGQFTKNEDAQMAIEGTAGAKAREYQEQISALIDEILDIEEMMDPFHLSY
jgi:hypothetical protein